jgi:glutamate racemase
VSAVGLDELSREATVPVVGVLEPGARAAVRKTVNSKVGVIGTAATIKSSAYAKAIHAVNYNVEVTGHACPLFVPLVEEGWLEGQVPELAAEKYLEELKTSAVDTLVLGCTHYPLLKKVISKVMGERVTLIDSAEETALEVREQLLSLELENRSSEEPVREFCVTDSPDGFRAVGERFLGQSIENISKVKLEVFKDES